MKEICLEKLCTLLKEKSVSQVAEEFGVGYNTIIRRARKFGIEISNTKPHLRNLPELTQDQHDLITGTLLGDGSLWCNQNRESACYRFGQCSQHLSYVQYVHEIMKPFCSDIKEDKNKRFFYTFACPIFTKLKNIWYPKGKKIVPEIKLNSRILYFWYLDDGSNDVSDKSINLYTDGFTRDESEFLCTRLKSDVDVSASVNKRHHKKYGIYYFVRLKCGSYFDFMNLIKDAGPKLDCMKRKFICEGERIKYKPRLKSDIENVIVEKYINNWKVKDISKSLQISISTIERIVYADPELKQIRKANKN